MSVDLQVIFLDYYRSLGDMAVELKRMLDTAIAAGRKLREAQKHARALMAAGLKEPETILQLAHLTSTISDLRPIAQLNATAVIVATWALVEDIRDAVGVNKDAHHGPKINGVLFTELLWAAGNSTRHGRAWWGTLMSAVSEHVLSGHDPASFDPSTPYDKKQVRSVRILVEGLGESWNTITPTPDICYDALELLSEGDSDVYLRRLFDVGAEIAHTNKTALTAFDQARGELENIYKNK